MDEIKNTFVVAHHVKMFNVYCRIIKRLINTNNESDKELKTEGHIEWYNNNITTPVKDNNDTTSPLIPSYLQKKFKKIEGKAFDFESLKKNRNFQDDAIICALNDLLMLMISQKAKEINSMQTQKQETVNELQRLQESKTKQLQELMASLALEKKKASDQLRSELEHQCKEEKKILEDQIKNKEEELAEKTRQLEQKDKEIKEKDAYLANEIKRIEESKLSLQEQINRLQTENANSVQQEAQSRTELQSRIDAQEADLNAKKTALNECVQEKQELQKSYDELQTSCNEDKNKLENKIKSEIELNAKLKKQYEDVKKTMLNLKKSADEEAALRAQLEKEQQIKEELEQKNIELENKLNEEQKALKELNLKYAIFNNYDVDKLKELAKAVEDTTLIRNKQVVDFLVKIGVIKYLGGPNKPPDVGLTGQIRSVLSKNKRADIDLERLIQEFTAQVRTVVTLDNKLTDLKVDGQTKVKPGARA